MSNTATAAKATLSLIESAIKAGLASDLAQPSWEDARMAFQEASRLLVQAGALAKTADGWRFSPEALDGRGDDILAPIGAAGLSIAQALATPERVEALSADGKRGLLEASLAAADAQGAASGIPVSLDALRDAFAPAFQGLNGPPDSARTETSVTLEAPAETSAVPSPITQAQAKALLSAIDLTDVISDSAQPDTLDPKMIMFPRKHLKALRDGLRAINQAGADIALAAAREEGRPLPGISDDAMKAVVDLVQELRNIRLGPQPRDAGFVTVSQEDMGRITSLTDQIFQSGAYKSLDAAAGEREADRDLRPISNPWAGLAPERTPRATTPLPFMSKSDWDDLGPMGPMNEGRRFFSQEIERDAYTGLDVDQIGEDPDRGPRPVRPYHPHVVVMSARHPLGNPHRGVASNDYERAWGLYQHYQRVLSARGEEARRLVNALAQTAERLQAEGGDRQRADAGEIAAQAEASGLDRRTAQEIGEQAASQELRGRGTAFTVVAPTVEEARIIRGMIDWATTIVPTSRDLKSQQLLTRNDQLPSVEDMLKALEGLRPEPWGQNLQANRGQGRDFVRAMAVIPARGAEQALARVAARQPEDVLLLVPDNWGFQKALRAEMGDAAYDARVWTRSKEQELETGIDIPDLQDLKGGDFARAYRETVETLVSRADRVLVAQSDDPRDFAVTAAAEAARRGKLAAAVAANGTVIRGPALDRLAEQAMKASPSRAEYARSRTVELHDVQAGSPEGRLALSLLRQAGGKDLPNPAIEALARTGMTINELADMAKGRDTAQILTRQHGVPIGAVAALADDFAMAAARDAFGKIREDLQKEKVQVVGPDAFPPALREGKGAPAVLFIRGNAALLSAGRPTIGILGDAALLPAVAERAGAFVRGVEAAGGVPVSVEGMGVPRVAPEGPQIVVLATGHGHYGKLPALDWKEVGTGRRSDVLVAETPNRRYTIEIVEGRDQKILFTVENPAASGEGAKRTTEMPLRGERPRPFYAEEDIRGQKEGAKWNGDIRHAKDFAQSNEAFIRSGDVRAHRQAVLDAGGVLVSLLPPRREGILFSHATQDLEGMPTDRRPENEHRAIELVAKIADVSTITQASQTSPVRLAVALSAARGRRVAVLPPTPDLHLQPEIGGNRALLTTPAAQLSSEMSLPGEMGLVVAKAFGTGKAAVSTGPDMAKAAATLVEKAETIEADLDRAQAKRRIAGGDSR